MQYNHFIGTIKKTNLNRIWACAIPNSSSIERIPDAFALLLPDIIDILNKNLDKLCKPNEGLVVFGLQPTGSMITSNQPMALNRYLQEYQPDFHFCCSLEYKSVPLEEIHLQQTWDRTETVIVDFTSGNIMDCDQYLYNLSATDEPGAIYGAISSYNLSIVWTIIRIKQKFHDEPGSLNQVIKHQNRSRAA